MKNKYPRHFQDPNPLSLRLGWFQYDTDEIVASHICNKVQKIWKHRHPDWSASHLQCFKKRKIRSGSTVFQISSLGLVVEVFLKSTGRFFIIPVWIHLLFHSGSVKTPFDLQVFTHYMIRSCHVQVRFLICLQALQVLYRFAGSQAGCASWLTTTTTTTLWAPDHNYFLLKNSWESPPFSSVVFNIRPIRCPCEGCRTCFVPFSWFVHIATRWTAYRFHTWVPTCPHLQNPRVHSTA